MLRRAAELVRMVWIGVVKIKILNSAALNVTLFVCILLLHDEFVSNY